MAPTGYAFTLPQLACLHDRETAALQAIKAVQGSHLVGLGQGGIVEDRVTKIFDRPPHAQHRLANVDYLGGAVADDVHPEQFERVGIEDQLQQSLLIAQHLPLGELGVARHADLIRLLLFCQLLLGAPYHRDFRNGVDPVRNQIGRHFAGFAEHMTAGQSPLLHRCAGQRRKANDVAGRVDVGYLGLEVLADRDLAALVGAQAGGIDVEQIAVGLASDGVQQRLAVYVLAAFQFGEDPVALRVEADRNHPLPQPKDSAQLPQLKAQALDDLPVHELQQRRALIEQGHLHPSAANMDAYSSPIMPAPTMTSSLGSSSSECSWSESNTRLPSMGISWLCAGRVPHAISTWCALSTCAPSSFMSAIVWGSRKRASPSTTLM